MLSVPTYSKEKNRRLWTHACTRKGGTGIREERMLISYQFVQFRFLLLICSVKKLKFTILKNSAPSPTIIRVSRIGFFAHEHGKTRLSLVLALLPLNVRVMPSGL